MIEAVFFLAGILAALFGGGVTLLAFALWLLHNQSR